MRNTFSCAGVLRTGGLLLLACVSLPLMAQQQADRPGEITEKSARVVERGAHHARWQYSTNVIDPETGVTNTVVTTYTQLETGLHFQNQRGEWTPASDRIDIIPGYAVAQESRHQARWAANINTYGAVEFWTPEGELARSHVLGLAYFDPDTGASAMIATIKDSIGTVGGNEVIYEDAFDDVDAAIRYRFTKHSFEQDIVIRAKLPDPALWGFDPDTVQLQVLTEFVALPASATAETREELLSAEGFDLNLIRSTTENFTRDYAVSFGEMQMARGRAFRLSDGFQESSVPVRKKLEIFEGERQILVEAVDFRFVAPLSDELPESTKPTASTGDSSRVRQQASALRRAPSAPSRQTADNRLLMTRTDEQLALSDTSRTQRGLVIDYLLLGSTTNLTLQADTTYYVTGPVTASGTTHIEGNAVVKFANTNSPYLRLLGTYVCQTAPYRPAIFTSALDGTVGETISYTNAATTYYATNALWIDSGTSELRHIHIRDAWTGIHVSSGASSPHTFSHVQMINCRNGVTTGGPTFHLRNALFNNVTTNFHSTVTATGHVEHLTANVAGILKGTTSLTLNVTNSLLVQITNASTINSSVGNATYATSSGVFQSALVGLHYLATSSTNRNAGVTNINAQLKTDFAKMSTEAPSVITATFLAASTNYAPAVARDADIPDRGYHYQPLDYIFNALIITNVTVNLTNGVSVGTAFTYGYGISVRPNGNLNSVGKPDAPNRLVYYGTVQEQATTGYSSPVTGTSVNAGGPWSGAPGLSFRFTHFSLFTTNQTHLAAGFGTYSDVVLRDCEFSAGRISIQDNAKLTSNNSLFERTKLSLSLYASTLSLYNNTWVGGTIDISVIGSGTVVNVKDNLFDRSAIVQNYSVYPTTFNPSHNGYVTNYSRWNYLADVVLPDSPAYEAGPLGNRYLPTASPLINAGSRSAGTAGLFHYTVLTNQTKDAATTVDIGYHYVAATSGGVPLDTDGDGTPDYVEDPDGDGVFDPGESNFGLFVAAGSTWKYLDNGSNQGTNWYSTSFNDTAWASGPAELGYGDGGESTVVSYGGNASNKYITTYFRKTFSAAGLDALPGLVLKLKRDDGAVVYLNGVEIRRDNMPAGTITHTNRASATVDGSNESTFFNSSHAASTLVPGVNVLAAEIHQVLPNSSDISFDLELAWNYLPVINWVTPTNGSSFLAGTNVTLSVSASDDLGLTKVVFYRSGVRIGESTTPSGGIYSLTWTNVPAGSHLLTAKAIDIYGVTATTTPIAISVQSKALFVAASTTLNSAETTISNRLVNLGFSVLTKSASTVSSNDATTASITVLSSSSNPADLTTKFKFTPTPVVVWEDQVYDDLAFTGTPSSEYGTTASQTNIVMTGTTHELAAGFSGTITVTTNAATLAWGKPTANAVKVATVAGDSTKVVIYGYEKGAQMTNHVAPGRRVGFFLSDTTAASLTGNGWTLFDAAILWAGAQPCYPAVDVAVVLDNSSSMNGQPLIDAKFASSNFVSRLEFLSDQGAVVSFSSTGVIRQTLTNDLPALTTAIYSIPQSSGSRIDLGIDTGRVHLASSLHNPSAAKVMLLLSDGKPSGTTTNAVLAAANAAKADGVRIFTVGFGSIDATLLSMIASSPTDFFSAPSSSDLNDLFSAVAEAICRLPENVPPWVEMVAPTNQPVLSVGANITLAAKAWDQSGIDRVKFFLGTDPTPIATVTVPAGSGDYEYTWSNRPAGRYTVWARATDPYGITADSAVEVFTVNPTNAYPVATLTAPTNGASYRAGQQIVLTATATDSDGIKLVEFFNGTNLLGSDSFAPYSFTIPCAAEGTYQFLARATDNVNYRASSAIHTVTVGAPAFLSAEGYWDPAFGTNSLHAANAVHYRSLGFRSNGELFAGVKTSSDPTRLATIWRNCAWQRFDTNYATSGNEVLAALPMDSDIVLAGSFAVTAGGATLTNIARWNGTNWLAVGDGLGGGTPAVYALALVNGNIVAGGAFTNAGIGGNSKHVALLSGTNWLPVGSGLSGVVRAFATAGGYLYAGGEFTSAGGNTNIKYLAKLVGTNWVAVGGGVNGPVHALATCGQNLFAGGSFTSADGNTNANGIAVWDGTGWSTVANGVGQGIVDSIGTTTVTNIVESIVVRGNEIFVGGDFTKIYNLAATNTANYIAKAVRNSEDASWEWFSLNNGVMEDFSAPDMNLTHVHAVVISEHASGKGYDVIVGGRFRKAGYGQPNETISQNIARWVVGETDCQPQNLPTVSIIAPASGARYTNSVSDLAILASAAGNGGNNVANVTFYVNGVQVGDPDTGSPYSVNWSSSVLGFHEFTAKVTDTAGQVTVSAPVHVQILSYTHVTVDDNYVVFANDGPTVLQVLTNDLNGENVNIGAVWRFDYLVPFESRQPMAGGDVQITTSKRRLIYTPRPGAFGRDVFIYHNSDLGSGAFPWHQTATVTIDVRAKPEVAITSPADGWVTNLSATVPIIASSFDPDGSVTNLILRVNGNQLASYTNAAFTYNWSTNTHGFYTFTVEAKDNHGYSTISEPVTVHIPGNSTPPVAELTNLLNTETPISGTTVTNYHTIRDGLFDLQGSAYDIDSTSAYQVLLYRPDDQEAPFANVTPGTLNSQGFREVEVTAASLGVLDLTTVPNGIYVLKLCVRGGGQESVDAAFVSIDSQLKLGQFSFSEQDLVIPVNGFPLTVIRTYDSQNHVQGDFGWNWTYAINDLDVVFDEERTPWPAFSSLDADDPTDGSVPYVNLRLGGGRNVTLTLPGGERTTFTFSPEADPENQRALARWTNAPGVTAKLEILGNDVINYFPWLHWQASGPQTPFDQYDLPGFALTTLDGTRYEMERAASPGWYAVEDPAYQDTYIYVAPQPGEMTLRRIVQRTGDVIDIGDSEIAHRFKLTDTNITRKITFERDGDGRITAIRDPLQGTNGHASVKYIYSPTYGHLKEVHKLVDRATGSYLTNRYLYHDTRYPHYLTSIEDARGKQVARQLFDDAGKLIGIVDASGRTNSFSYNLTNRTQVVTDRLNNPTTYQFDPRGNVTAVVNPLNQTNSFTYDDLGNVLTAKDALGNTTTNSYDPIGNLLSTITPMPVGANPANYTTTFAYDQFGNQTNVTLPSGAVMASVFDANTGLLLDVKDGAGNLISGTRYNQFGQATNEFDLFGTNRFGYDVLGNATKFTNSLNQVITSGYDANGQLTNLLDGGVTSSFAYDALGRDRTADYGNGITLTNTYQAQLEWTNVAGPTIGTMGRSFDDHGRLAGWTTANGATPGFLYDENGRLRREVSSVGVATEYAYDEAGRVTLVTNLTTTARTTYGYDAAGRRFRVVNALGHTNLFDYWPSGSLRSMTNATGTNVWQYTDTGSACAGCGAGITNSVTDPLNRVTETVNTPYGLPYQVIRRASAGATNSLAVTNTTAYLSGLTTPEQEAQDYPASITDEGGRTRNFGYTALGQLQWASDLGGNKWTNNFDAASGALLSVKSPTGATLSYTYDTLDNVKTITFADNGVLTNFCDAANRLHGVGLPNGQRLTNTFDFAGRLTNQTVLTGAATNQNVAFTYNLNDTLTSITDHTGLTTNRFDAAGRLSSVTQPTGATAGYELDVLGRVISVTNKASSGGTAYITRYKYDSLGNVTNVVDPWSGNTYLEYDRVGRKTKRTLPNNVVTEWQYNWKDQVTNITHKISGTTLASVAYERATGGEPNKITREDGTYSLLAYDGAWRLTNEVYYSSGGSPTATNGYAYDASGTRTLLRTGGVTYTNAVVNGYQVTQVKRASDGVTVENYYYDAGGRVTNIVRTGLNSLLTFNTADQLTSVAGQTYVFDGAGRRVKATGGTERRFLVASTPGTDLESPHLVADSGNALKQAYVFLGDEPLIRYDGSNGNSRTYYLEDGMGSVVGLTPQSSPTTNNTSRIFYDGFGNIRATAGPAPTSPTGTGGDFRFHGLWLEDASGLYHVRARDYDPKTGRFLSRDPIPGEFRAPESLQPYSYAVSNPIVCSDPSGRFTLIEVNIASGKQAAMQAFKGLATAKGRKKALKVLGELIKDKVLESVENIFPGMELLSSFDEGNDFSGFITDLICDNLDVPDSLYLEVPLYDDGEPYADGFNCNEGVNVSELMSFVSMGLARPDFVVSGKPPTEGKAWVVGELKSSTKTLMDQYGGSVKPRQFNALMNYARDHVQSRTALIICAIRGKEAPGDAAIQTRVVFEGLKMGAFPVVVIIKE